MIRVAFFMLGGLSACAAGGPPVVPPDLAVADNGLAEGDVVDIRVFREPDLAGTFQVDGDGAIDFPLVGRVLVEGHTSASLARELETRLEDGYLVEAQVTVLIKERASRKVHVLGSVNKPGSFPYEPGMTVIQAITNAGGFSAVAAKNNVTVTRRLEEGESSFQVKVGDIQSGSAPNFYLQPRDIIYVRESIF